MLHISAAAAFLLLLKFRVPKEMAGLMGGTLPPELLCSPLADKDASDASFCTTGEKC